MSIPTRLSSYLDQRGTRYEICMHKHSRTSAETARAADIPPHQLAKSVIVEDDIGYVMAVVPADRNVQLGQLSRLLDREHLRLADENRIAAMFTDCDRGAVPALGMAWGVPTVIDDELEANDVVYLESGDHERLLCLSNDQFHELMLPARHGHFCGERVH
ncbi:MAG TPA: YbaK/EbsC family protein [Burkholderiaceae bacterium]